MAGSARRPLLIHFAELDSTQAFLRRHPELGHCAVVADAQSEGRGRQGNAWISAPGAGLWMSVALPPPELMPGIVLQRAMAKVAECLQGCGVQLGLKWPNDLVAYHEGRLVKLGGIIGEKAGERLILGLGVNLRSAPRLKGRRIPAASLQELSIAVPDPRALARTILDAWQHLETEAAIPFRWPENGSSIQWEQGQGVALGWEEDGRLKVATAAGIERLSAAEISGLTRSAP
ncbi:MAG: biotin--[acetyl-CoA-carboxylase] ligase [Holophagaceae bacterium]|nr:biotin--[acetyl-CoA-carboxylase] ligase [Holophagaceae bacterium]